MPTTAQNWEFNAIAPFDLSTHENNLRIVITQGETSYVTVSVDTKIKDIIGTPLVAGYSNLKLKTFFESVDNLDITMSCVVSGLNVNIFSGATSTLTYSNGMIGRMRYDISNLYGLAPGTYTGKGVHQILGNNASGVLTVIDEEFFNITYQKYATGTIHAFSDTLYYSHTIGNPLPPAKKVSVWAPGSQPWVLTADPNFVLSTLSSYVTIGVDGSGNPTATGTDSRDVYVELGPIFAGITQEGATAYTFPLTYPGGTSTNVIANIQISNEVFDLYFSAIKFFTEPVEQTVSFLSSSVYNTSSPTWLIVTPSFASGTLTLAIIPLPTNQMTAGIYTGTITVEYDVSGTIFTKIITVTYELHNFLTIPYADGENAFTLDKKYFEFTSANANTYFQFNALVKAFDFFTNTFKEYNILQKIVLFQGFSKINLGQKIHRLMDKFANVNDIELQYLPALLTVTCEEKAIIDNSIIRSLTSNEIPFIAGLSRGITTIGILDFNLKPNRVTTNSFAYINMLVPTGDYELRVFINNQAIAPILLQADTGMILTEKLTFSNYYPGDVLDYVLIEQGASITGDEPKKTFIVFPEGFHSNMLVWENEFLVQSALECTGTASINSELEFQSQKVFDLLVEKLEHLSSSKEVKLYMNTGWLLNSDVDTIESLMRSKRAWLIQGNETISLRPLAKKIPNQDLERELIEFPLEFTINRNYDEETYSL